MTKVIEADLSLPEHAEAVLELLDGYARGREGGGNGLGEQVKRDLIPALQHRQDALVLLAMWDGQAVGLLNAFEAFSTFAASPLLNIHDVFVLPTLRGKGIGRALFQYAERVSRDRGYCKMTLEVLSGNTPAQCLYRAQGFEAYVLDEEMGQALFWQKKLS